MTRATGLHDIAAALGGDLHHGGRTASVPAPGHSRADRSVSLLLDQDRVVIHGFGSTGWREVRAHLVGLGLIDAAGRLTGATTGVFGRASVTPIRPPPRGRMAVAQMVWGGPCRSRKAISAFATSDTAGSVSDPCPRICAATPPRRCRCFGLTARLVRP